jgi:outer membrane receptor for ferrienterochelin and colicin
MASLNYHVKPLLWVLVILLIQVFPVLAQKPSGRIKGRIINQITREPLPFTNIIIKGTTNGTTSDVNGDFEITNVSPGYVRLEALYVGYKTRITEEIFVTNEKIPYIIIEMEPAPANLEVVEISTPLFVKKEESPVSMQTLGIREIEKNPGGNRDISKVIQSLPGVASSPSFRNDIIIRGGSPSENKFYLDGIEIPVINHFQTQGSTGGPVGIINVDFIREVDFYSGAFPANRGNTMSSVMEFRQIDGNSEKAGYRATLGSSDIGFTADGPLGKNTTYIASIRRSYLQFLFSALKLPFLPTFTDAQFKVKHRISDRSDITFIGIGAYDEFEINKSVNEGVTDPETLERNNYLLGVLPTSGQWNYTTGAVYRHFGKQHNQTLVLSRNQFTTTSEKYLDNDQSSPDNLIADYKSTETENKLRFENTYTRNTLKLNMGLNLENAAYSVDNFDYTTTATGPLVRDFKSDLQFVKYGVFASASKPVLKNRLMLSAGFRMDGNTYSDDMSNPFRQFSPRFSASWSLNEKLSLSFNTGKYFQLPAYTILGYRDSDGTLLNKQNNTSYISSTHLVGGIQFNSDEQTRFSAEVFNKSYDDYPFSLADSISLANLGSDFGVIGNEGVAPVSTGRAYGAEVMVQRRSREGLFGILAYTFVRSEFKEKDGSYAPSSWDSRHILTITAGRNFKKNWEAGLKWRYVAGRPYTPYDTAASALKSNWDVRKAGIPDYNYLNDFRLDAFHQLDIRIDKTWFYARWSLNLYLDIQNLYNFKAESPDILNVRSDANGNLLTDPDDADRYQIYFIKDESGTILPSIGVIVDF